MADHDQHLEDPIVAEEVALAESDATLATDEADSGQEVDQKLEEEVGAAPVESAELAAMHTDTEAAQEASGDVVAEEAGTKSKKPAKKAAKKASKDASSTVRPKLARKQPRSAKYLAAAEHVNKNKFYQPKEAFTLVKDISYAKFDAAVEVHIKLVDKKGKSADSDRLRMMVALPHGTGREPKIGVLDEALIDQIKQKGDTEFDILLAAPAMMPKVAQIAKILGPKGKMPNPKTGTVTDDPDAAKAAIVSGRVEIRADANNNIHQSIGRVSWPSDKLFDNYRALIAVLPSNRLQRVSVTVTMGPSLTIDHNE